MLTMPTGYFTEIQSNSRILDAYVVINGVTYYSDQIVELYFSHGVLDETYTVGNTPSAYLRCTLANISAATIVDNTVIEPYIGVDVSGTLTYLKVGKFYIEESQRDIQTITVHAMDKMVQLEQTYVPVITYPNTLTNVLADVLSGISYSITLPAYLSSLSVGKLVNRTKRQMLGYIAELMGGFAYVDRSTEQIKIKVPSNTPSSASVQTIDQTQYFDLYREDNLLTISGINLSDGANIWTSGTTSSFVLDVTSPFAVSSIASNVLAQVTGTPMISFNAKFLGNPALELGDSITVVEYNADDTTTNRYLNIGAIEIQFTPNGFFSTIKNIGEGKAKNTNQTVGDLTSRFEFIDARKITAGEYSTNWWDTSNVTTESSTDSYFTMTKNELAMWDKDEIYPNWSVYNYFDVATGYTQPTMNMNKQTVYGSSYVDFDFYSTDMSFGKSHGLDLNFAQAKNIDESLTYYGLSFSMQQGGSVNKSISSISVNTTYSLNIGTITGTSTDATAYFSIAQSFPRFNVGDTITISGNSQAIFNGSKVVTESTTTYVKFSNTFVGSGTGGTISENRIRLTFTTIVSDIPFQIGETINISGNSIPGYNGDKYVLSCTTTYVEFASSASGTGTGGFVRNIKNNNGQSLCDFVQITDGGWNTQFVSQVNNSYFWNKVGIGVDPTTTGSSSMLQVNGAIRIQSGSDAITGNVTQVYHNASSVADFGLYLRHFNGGIVDALIGLGGYGSNNGRIIFQTGTTGTTASTRVVITETGNVGINTSSPVAGLSLTTTFRQEYTNNSAGVIAVIRNSTTLAGTDVLNVSKLNTVSDTTGTFITCTDSAGLKMRVMANGNLQNVNNSYGSTSDKKLKENIVDATEKLMDLMKVRVRNYNFIGSDMKQIGVVAQELQEVFPGLIESTPDYDENGKPTGEETLAVKYSVFTPILIKAIQELTDRVIMLENKQG